MFNSFHFVKKKMEYLLNKEICDLIYCYFAAEKRSYGRKIILNTAEDVFKKYNYKKSREEILTIFYSVKKKLRPEVIEKYRNKQKKRQEELDAIDRLAADLQKINLDDIKVEANLHGKKACLLANKTVVEKTTKPHINVWVDEHGKVQNPAFRKAKRSFSKDANNELQMEIPIK